MRRTLAVIVVVGLLVSIAEADEKPTPPPTFSTVTPENDWRLAKQTGTQPQKIGVLSYYPNNGGGYTFLEGKHIAFYSLPYAPTTYWTDNVVVEVLTINGNTQTLLMSRKLNLYTIGTSKMPFGGQTVYRSEMKDMNTGVVFRRQDMPIAKWSRDAAGDEFRLSILDVDRETRPKLKSIIPVLERAEHAR